MSDARGFFLALAVVMLLGFGISSCLKADKHEDCKQRGGQLVHEQGSTYRCDNPEVK